VTPANLVNLEAVSKSYGTTVLLDQVSLGVAAGQRIGVVGVNGGGKSTLMRVLTRREEPDSGRVTHVRDLRLEYVGQHAQPAGENVRAAVLARFDAEHVWASDAEVRAVLAGLGLPELGLDAPTGAMSGGEQRRVALAAALVHQPDLLVLDEPTNHLDVDGVAWLAGYLASRRGALVVVTHDRWFLDAVCERTWEVGGGQVQAYDGGYAAYVLARAERARRAAAAQERRRNLLRKELAWLRRGPPARTSKPQFRIDAAQALIADEPPPRDSVGLHALASSRLGRSVYDVEDVTLRLDDRLLLDQVTWRLGPGDRVGLVGVNGSGKTTLLQLLLGEVQPQAGRVRVGRTVRPAYLSQEVAELPSELRLLAAVEEVARVVRVGGVELTASQLAERFGFGSSRQWTPVGDLSGGERRRLQLLRLLMTEPNVLLLDEPTNDLDVDTLTAVEDLLDSWPGTLVVVSHDRYLVERVCDSVVALLGDGSLVSLPGGVEEYLRRRRDATVASRAPASAPAAGHARPRGGGSRAARKERARLERRIAALEAREKQLHRELVGAATDYTRLSILDAELHDVLAEREAAETAWLELAEES
jgi:ABC transport system ATP-binding/permease protein